MSVFVGELLGTMILILLGNGVVAAVLLNRSKAQNAGWMVITAGWAFAVMCGIFTAAAFGAPGALNPASTIAGMVMGGTAAGEAALQIVGQVAGAFLGAVLVWVHYLPHWGETGDADLKFAAFSTTPAIRKPAANLISEIIGTFVLIFVATAIGRSVAVAGVGPYLIGALVWGIGLSLGGTTGYAINPARDFGPRLAHALLPIRGKGGSDWGYAWVPIVGPVVGAILAALLFRLLAAALQR